IRFLPVRVGAVDLGCDCDASRRWLPAQGARPIMSRAWALARSAAHHSRPRREPAAIADDQAGEGMADLDVKMKATVGGKLVGIDSRPQRPRHRDAAEAPAPLHELEAAVLAHQRHAEAQRPKPLAQKPLEAAAARLLDAGERAPCKRTRPDLPPAFCAKR